MITEKPMHELIQMTPQAYDDFIFERYMRWCESKHDSKKENDLQKLLSNRALANWFITEFSIYENEFAKMVRNTHMNFKPEQIRSLYTTCTIQIYSTFPKPLIEAAQKVSIINMINLN